MTQSTLSSSAPASSGPAERLQTTMAAARVSFCWLGVRKTLTPSQKAQAAEPFGADQKCLSAAKRLLDIKHPAFKAVTSVKNHIAAYWKGVTLPYPEPGIRLIRQDHIEQFNDRMTQHRVDLEEAVENLDRRYDDLRAAARQQLGRLFNEGDYPPSLAAAFGVDWDFPSVEPPSYLMQLNPQLYEQERQRMTARFEEAIRLAEQAFTEEFSKLVGHITERLSGAGPDGKPKIFRDSAVTNLAEFFERFRELNVQSNPELDRLVETARKSVRGVKPQALRDDQSLRQEITGRLSAVAKSLDELLVDRPRRRILRTAGHNVPAGPQDIYPGAEEGRPAGAVA